MPVYLVMAKAGTDYTFNGVTRTLARLRATALPVPQSQGNEVFRGIAPTMMTTTNSTRVQAPAFLTSTVTLPVRHVLKRCAYDGWCPKPLSGRHHPDEVRKAGWSTHRPAQKDQARNLECDDPLRDRLPGCTRARTCPTQYLHCWHHRSKATRQ